MRPLTRLGLSTLLSLVLVVPLLAQEEAVETPVVEAPVEPGSRTLGLDDYNLWRTIDGMVLSADGRWAAWSYGRRREADPVLHVVNLEDGREHVIERGRNPELSDDGRWVVYESIPGWEEIEKAEKAAEPVSVQAVLLDLVSGESQSWDDVDGFEIARGARALVVSRKKDKEAKHEGRDLILRWLGTGAEELLGSVHLYAFDKAGAHLAYTVDAADDNGNGVHVVDLTTGMRRPLDNAQEDYARLTWSEEGTALAVLRGSKPEGMEERANVLLAFPDVDAPEALAKLTPDAEGFPDDFVISERGALRWNDGGTQLFFGIKEQRPEPEKTDEPIADVNVFHWQDDRIQTVQKVEAERDRDFTHLSVFHLDTGRPIRLGTERLRRFELSRRGRWAIGFDREDYISDWEPSYADVYRVDTRSGDVTPMLERQLRTYGLSPDGRYFLYWRDGDMHAWDLESDASVNLTAAVAADFTDAEWDYFGERPPYGVAGWSADGDSVLLEHRYDIWRVSLDGSGGDNYTAGFGDGGEIRLRHLQLDPDAETIDLTEPQLLSAYGQWTKKDGFMRLPAGGGSPAPLIWADKSTGRPMKARAADRYAFTVEAFHQFPDYWTVDYSLADGTVEAADNASDDLAYGDDDGDDPSTPFAAGLWRVTDANPQQLEYRWGRRILFDYENSDGVRLQGILAIPDDRVEGERRPMLVRFYEKYSQDLHRYPTVRYRHEPNFADYVSHGYLVMQPDVHFRGGSSHSDMLECVEAATRTVIEMGYAEPSAIGLAGHSYSGGGSSYIAARSDMFAAVASGAAPINLTSEFNQLFLGTGGNNHSYDIYGQGRYGTNPYDDPELYAFESPITWVRDMDTPLLYLHGEEDQIVGWVQGIEWYNALRFNSKPIIFLSYPDEGHGLRKFESQYDFQSRLHQFFDHHLRDEPAPPWMVEGVPYLEKERNLRRRER